jgi:DNA-binding transcriptional MerR regulator
MGHNQPIRGGTHGPGASSSEIPDKLYFRIGEVARLCEVPTYVLRFWESEFPQLKPNKGGTGQRLYRRRDVEMALRVKTLLKDEGYTIPGARQVLKAEFKQKEPQLSLLQSTSSGASVKQLRSLRRELEAIAAMLAKPLAQSTPSPKATTRTPQTMAHPIRSPRRASTPPARSHVPEIPFDPAD